ncbi:A/G-specific adenine glycosylase [Campylobacter hepaticus]|uniref:A/G-specific adenine glycosylase n=1 Tax=Campylobacter hepaticus TaxID=1813019 RepID=A0A424Z1Z6_9BACT|nr:A/G-specific adenine glycosylase [Campylobacter hepaticus]MDX2323561.1 A/G-specific adenine glycosylase [Campylobacter hepaticus]MDX2331403.1 A/G-specific adenine glycosylase [Campylobacter hepaticus]MDX2332823.1 A/G-specific adenine glycosylase [Campylobacter hepaticus]MDX2372026.1 A/G-specific adenine glycosylase [Campylobacter hepaticus]MDX2397239.1 A/G-specific adenine glycosylase [Campylobacter hepaticus]
MQKATIEKLQNNLLFWYEKNGRKSLPWRNLQSQNCDARLKHINRAYGVYISEIMLQQTQVKSVLEKFYFPFLEKFPNLKSLAYANEDEILKLWQGLGYYTRARNLKKAALKCMVEFKGNLPKELNNLKKLNGIGAYTAGAIACFAYDQKVSFVDANIRRVISRLFALENPSMKELEQKAQELLNLNDAFNHNQALLDIGALICISKNPKCGVCPLCDFCQGKIHPKLYPRAKKIFYDELNLDLFLFELDNNFAVQKSNNKLYKGMYNFPFFNEGEFKIHKNMRFLTQFRHSYTKYKLSIKVYHQVLEFKDEKYEFKSLKEIENLPLSTLSLKALKLIKL